MSDPQIADIKHMYLGDGPKNVLVRVWGWLSDDISKPVQILNVKDMTTAPDFKGLKLESILWLIEEKAGIRLWWSDDLKTESLIAPLESRNSVRFDRGQDSPRLAQGWKKGIWMTAVGVRKDAVVLPKYFNLLLDFDKQ